MSNSPQKALICRPVNAALMPLPGVFFHLELRQGATLLAEKRRFGAEENKKLYIFVNGVLCEDDAYAVRELDVIVWALEPAGGLKNLLGLVAVVALAAALPVLSGYLTATLGFSAFSAGLITAGVGLVGTLAINALFPPPSQPAPEAVPSGRQLYYLTSIRNTANPYGVVPMVIGKHKLYPHLAGQPYPELYGNDQILYMVFGWLGEGEIEDNAVFIGNTPVTDYEGIEYRLHLPNYQTDPAFEIVKRQVSIEQLGVDMSFEYGDNIPNSIGASTQPNQGWHQRRTEPETTAIGLQFDLPRGLGVYQEIKKSKDRPAARARTVEIEVQYREAGTTAWHAAIWEDQVAYNANPNANPLNSRVVTGGQWFGIINIDYSAGPKRQPATVQRRTLIVSDDKIGTALRRGIFIEVPEGQYDVRCRLRSSRSTATRKILQIADNVLWTLLKSYKDDAPVTDPDVTVLEMKATASRQLTGAIDSLNFTWKAVSNWLWSEENQRWIKAHTENPASWFLEVAIGRTSPVYSEFTEDDVDMEGMKEWYNWCAFNGYKVNRVIDRGVNLLALLKDIAAAGRASLTIRDGKLSVIVDRPKPAITQMFTSANSYNYQGALKYQTLPHGLKVQFINEENDYQQDQLIVYQDGYDEDNASTFEVMSLPGITTAELVYKHTRNYMEQVILRPEEHTIEVDIDNLIAQRGDRVRFSHEVNSSSYGAGRVKAFDASTRTLTFDRPVLLQANVNTRVQVFLLPGREQSWWTFLPPTTGYYSSVRLGLAPSAQQAAAMTGKSFVIGQLDRFALDCLVSRIEPLPKLRARVSMVAYHLAMYDDESLPIPKWDPGIIQYIGHRGVGQLFPPLAPRAPAPRKPPVHIITEDGRRVEVSPGDDAVPFLYDPRTGAPIYKQIPLAPVDIDHKSDLTVMQVVDDTLVQRILFTFAQNPVDTWDINDLLFVVEGKPSYLDGTAWSELGSVPATEGQIYLTSVQEGQFWDFRFYFRSVKEVRSSLPVQINVVQIIGRGGPPSAPGELFINGKTLSWVHENPPLDVRYGGGYQLKYHYGNNDNWETAIPMHNKLLKASPFDLERFDNYHPYTFMLKSVDGLGIESDDFAVLRHNFGERTDKDIVKRIAFPIRQARDYTGQDYPPPGGALRNGRLDDDIDKDLFYKNGNLSGNILYPSRTNSDFWTDDVAPFWTTPGAVARDAMDASKWTTPSDNDPFWDVNHWEALEVFFRTTISEADVDDQLTIEMRDFAGLETLQYRLYGIRPFWGNDADAFWTGDSDPFWQDQDGAWQNMSGQQIAERLQAGIYEFRIFINPGEFDSVPVAVSQVDIVLDGVDKLENHNDYIIAADGSSVLQLFNSYPRRQNVSMSIQDIGTDVWRVFRIKRPKEIVLWAEDQYGNNVSASVDITVRGY